MIILPTRGRPDSIRRFIKQYEITKAAEPVILVRDHDDDSYNAIELPPLFSFKVMGPHGGITECVNAVFMDHPNEVYYGIMADDVVPQTPHWDKKLIEACLPYGISWGDDGFPEIGLPTHPFLAGDLVRAQGWVVYPGVKHWYADNAVLDIAKGLGVGKYLKDVQLPHYHILSGRAELDDTYLNQPSRETDEANYLHFRQKELPALLDRLRAAKP